MAERNYNEEFAEMERQMGSPFISPSAIPGDIIPADIVDQPQGDADGDHGPIVDDHGDHHHHADGTIHQNDPSEEGGVLNISHPFLLLQFQYEPAEEEGRARIAGLNISGGNGVAESKEDFIQHLKAAIEMLEGNEMTKG